MAGNSRYGIGRIRCDRSESTLGNSSAQLSLEEPYITETKGKSWTTATGAGGDIREERRQQDAEYRVRSFVWQQCLDVQRQPVREVHRGECQVDLGLKERGESGDVELERMIFSRLQRTEDKTTHVRNVEPEGIAPDRFQGILQLRLLHERHFECLDA